MVGVRRERLGMNTVSGPITLRQALAGRWQVPLLITGVLVFGGAVGRMVSGHRVWSFEERKALVSRLREAGALGRANAFLMESLKETSLSHGQRGELHRLLAATVHQAEAPLTGHKLENCRSIVSNYRAAQRQGAVLTADDWIALGDAYLWLSNEADALEAFRAASRVSANVPSHVRQTLVDLQYRKEGTFSADALAQLSELMESKASSPSDVVWAAERLVEWLLDQGDAAGALRLVAECRDRLAGTEASPSAAYLEAMARWKLGRPDEADALLRALRDAWTTRDELWARAGWLLGRLEQEDGRPQSALAFYEEVLASFATGEARDACLLGRAECLASLERYESALVSFHALQPVIARQPRGRYVDREALRATVATIGETVLRGGAASIAVQYFRLAVEWADSSAAATRAYLLNRLTDALEKLARERLAQDEAAARRAFLEAGEIQAELARLSIEDEAAAARAAERAAEDFDAAGDHRRLAEHLDWYTATHPSGLWRCPALLRLGHAYEELNRLAEARESYREVIRGCARLPEAMQAMIPLAECLLALGGENEQEGVSLLEDIIEDRVPQLVFSPQTGEYRDALFMLGEHYSRSDERARLERAIVRLEEAAATYPDDPRLVRAAFLLAGAYRRTAQSLRAEGKNEPSARRREAAEQEAGRRLGRALEKYRQVIALLADDEPGGLTELESTMLRSSYLYRGDCLFDMGRLPEAIAAYGEAVWRYENTPAAVSASMQIVHGHLRLGQPAEAAAALARLRWLLGKMPESAFEGQTASASKSYWQRLLARMEETGLN